VCGHWEISLYVGHSIREPGTLVIMRVILKGTWKRMKADVIASVAARATGLSDESELSLA
jgi:hypothetical protein